MPSPPGRQSYQPESGRTRASDRAARRFAALPADFTFTVDVEEHGAPGRAAAATGRLLDLLEAAGARGTFFVLDDVVRQDAPLVRDLARRGHEVASHGHDHRHLAQQGPGVFRAGILAARDRLADLLGAAPAGYRAPYFSLTPGAAWAPGILAEAGFAYSSSVLPAWNPLAGWPGAPRRPFLWPDGVLELPVPVGRFGPLLLPFLGGMYLRWLPPWRLSTLVRSWVAEGDGGHLWSYCHPYDLDAGEGLVRRADAGLAGSVMLWLNRGPTLPRLEGLLRGRRSEPFAARLPALRAAALPWRPDAAPQQLSPVPAA
jgi:polysaccharide deacetylase family protein (PEP-CTERM system associated)